MATLPLEHVSFREIIVDVLGSLVPGLIFIVCAALAIVWPLESGLQTWVTILGSPHTVTTIGAAISQVLERASIIVFLILIVLAYVVGCLFYRLDPKVPDQRSFKRTFKPGDSRLADWVAQNERECEFPYPRFDHYLKSRGLDHLVPIAAWCTTGKRTKNFINLLKIRLDFWHPAKCASVARNEAHVRLMASMWFMSRALQFVALGGCVVSSITYFAAVTMHLTHPVLVLVPTAPALLILAIATLTRFIIEHFLHYQRVREVFWVLETSYTAFRFAPAHIQDICPDFHEPDFER